MPTTHRDWRDSSTATDAVASNLRTRQDEQQNGSSQRSDQRSREPIKKCSRPPARHWWKNVQDETALEQILDDMDDFFNQLQALIRELRETGTVLRNSSKLSKPPRSPSPGPSNSRQSSKYQNQLSCAFCDGNHYASDCTIYTRLLERRNRFIERNRCERCLLRANHLTTSCPTKHNCHYCKTEKRESEMTKHNSAFCTFKFQM